MWGIPGSAVENRTKFSQIHEIIIWLSADYQQIIIRFSWIIIILSGKAMIAKGTSTNGYPRKLLEFVGLMGYTCVMDCNSECAEISSSNIGCVLKLDSVPSTILLLQIIFLMAQNECFFPPWGFSFRAQHGHKNGIFDFSQQNLPVKTQVAFGSPRLKLLKSKCWLVKYVFFPWTPLHL